MGFEVAAIGRGADKAEPAKKLGAHHYITAPRPIRRKRCRRSAAQR
jgi:D-arabinose 1-dehydrogenase-like Zn-dependent alcohol dehydrogenase